MRLLSVWTGLVQILIYAVLERHDMPWTILNSATAATDSLYLDSKKNDFHSKDDVTYKILNKFSFMSF